jgi:uncharacterized cupredoxin-like copper-binding protein
MTRTAKSIVTTFGIVLLLAFATAFVAACGGDDADPGDAAAVASAGQPEDDAHEDDSGASGDDGVAHEQDGDAHEEDGAAPADGGEAHDEEGEPLAREADLVLELDMEDFAFLPAKLTVKAGEVVHINAENTANNVHDFTIDKVDADMYTVLLPGAQEHEGMDGPMADLHFSMTEPGRGAVQIRINEPGEYVYYCSVPGHREAGMEGTLIVEPADG